MVRLSGWLIFIYLVFALQVVSAQVPDTLIIANSNGWPPFAYISEKGEPTGALIDFWKEFGTRTGKKIEFRLTDWKDSLDLVKTGKAHIHAGLFKLKEREAYMDFTDSLRLTMTYRPFISSKLKVSKIEDLGNIPVGVVKGDSNESYLKANYPAIRVKAYANTEILINAALAEEVLAFMADSMVTMHYIGLQGAQNRFYVIEELYTKTYYAAVTKGNQPLLDYINSYLATITEDDYQRIFFKWVPSVSKTPGWVVPVVGGLLGVLFATGFVFYLIYLRRRAGEARRLEAEVALRTEELRTSNLKLRDEVRARKAAEKEKDKVIDELQAALNEVNTLSGLLPICSSCKKIRDDSGYWNRLETYIAKHTGASFSHGLCEACAEELYGQNEWFKKGKKRQETLKKSTEEDTK